MFLVIKSYGQEVVKDSIWLSIAPVEKNTEQELSSNDSYRLLYVKPISLISITELPKEKQMTPLLPTTKDLLKQFHLANSYNETTVNGTSFEKSLQEAAYISYPFANILTASLADVLEIPNNNPQIVAYQDQVQVLKNIDSSVINTVKMSKTIFEDYQIKLDKRMYLRKRLLDLLVGNYNQKPESQHWFVQGNKIIPYLKSYSNQFMIIEGTHKLLKQILPAFEHFEHYHSRIKNLKKVNKLSFGFDVNILSDLSETLWEEEVQLIQQQLTTQKLIELQHKLPNTPYKNQTKIVFENLQNRIDYLDVTAKTYYKTISKNKIIYATHQQDKIEVIRKNNKTLINIYEVLKESNNPDESYVFMNANTDKIWIYGLNDKDYFTAFGDDKNGIEIALIGGKGGDKYVLENGKNITIYDEKKQTFLVETNQAKVNLIKGEMFTKTAIKKHKHTKNTIKPIFGANPDDGIFMGISDVYLIQDFNRNPFTQKHQLSAVFNIGYLGLDTQYYGEFANFSNHFNVFTHLGYQTPNYATNFFGFGNETPNVDTNLQLDYNRVRMETIDVKLGVVKDEKRFGARANLFFNSYQIEATEERFLTSETLFFPEKGFFDRKNYAGLALAYQYKSYELDFLPNLIVKPKISVDVKANLNDFKNSIFQVSPNVYVSHPLYMDVISLDATIDYNTVLGTDIPFYLASNIGGNSGVRGYRNQRFTGESSFYTSSNIKWKAKDLKSDVIPLQIGVFTGLDVGRVWVSEEESTDMKLSTGGGVWLQSADLMKAQLQVFGFDEGTRISFSLSMGF